MGYRELFTSYPLIFSGVQKTLEEAEYVILGVPFDVTSTFRSGARFAPFAIREASLNIETYSFRAGFDFEELKLHDLGDLNIVGEADETIRRVELVSKELLNENKLPVLIGGEHTITLGALQSMGDGITIVSFDAHLDLRNEYLGRTLSHATFMRRIWENTHPHKILEVGTRAVCREELEYAKEFDIPFLTTQQIYRYGIENTIEKIVQQLSDQDRIYLSIDMDVLDPAFAPAVQNPEPDGLSIRTLLDILSGICDERILGFDVVEVTPHYDRGSTAIQAAKIIFEILCYLETSKKN